MFPGGLSSVCSEPFELIKNFPSSCNFRLLSNGDNFDEAFDLESRGLVTMKGKAEPMKCWFLNRSKSDYVNVPHPEDLLR